MPRNITVTFADGTTHVYQNAPDDLTPEQVSQRAQSDYGKQVTALDGGRGGSRTPPPQQPQAPAPPQDEGFTISDPNQEALDAAGVSNMPQGSVDMTSDEYFAQQEAAYQDSLGNLEGDYLETAGPPPTPVQDKTGSFESGVLGFADSLSLGFGDEIDAGVGAILGGPGYETIWSGKGLKNAYNSNVAKNRDLLEASQNEHPLAYAAGGLASAAVPIGAFGRAKKATDLASGLSKSERALDAARITAGMTKGERAARVGKNIASTSGKGAGIGAVYGGLYGIGSDEGSLIDRLDGGIEGAAWGAGVGAALGPVASGVGALAKAAGRPARRARGAAKILRDRPRPDAEAAVVQDIGKLADNPNVAFDNNRYNLDIKTVNNLEGTYTHGLLEEIKAAGVPESDLIRYRKALSGKYTASPEEISGLRGSVPGDAVADAIERVQAVRRLTPPKPKVYGPILNKVASTTDMLPVPGIVGRGLRRLGRETGDAESTRAVSVDKLLQRRGMYDDVASVAGPHSGADSRQALTDLAQQNLALKEAERAMGTRKPPPEDLIDRMVANRIEGEYGAMNSFQNSLDISREDATRVLQSIAEDNPELARDVGRIVTGHGTVKNRMGPTFRPLMRAKMQELGITPRTAADDAAAQSRLSAVTDDAAPPTAAAKLSQRELELTQELELIDPVRVTDAEGFSMRDSEINALEPGTYQVSPEDAARTTEIRAELEAFRQKPQIRQVDRPMQWEQGRNRYVNQANDSIASMQRDQRLGREGVEALGNAPQQIRDNFRTTADAEEFIVSRVLPDLEASGISPAEIIHLRTYLFEIAQAKRYATQEAYEAGIRAMSRGRPRKNP